MAIWEEFGLNIKLWFLNPEKAYPCAEPRFDVFCVKVGAASCLGVRGRSRKSSRENKMMREIAHAQKPNPLSNLYKIWHDHRLRDFWVAGGYQLSIDVCCRRPRSASNAPTRTAAVDRRDRQTDGRTPDRYVDPAPYTMRAA